MHTTKNVDFPNFCPVCGIQLVKPLEQDDYYSDLRVLKLEQGEYNRFLCKKCSNKFCFHRHETI